VRALAEALQSEIGSGAEGHPLRGR
jgi:hypothetical protein